MVPDSLACHLLGVRCLLHFPPSLGLKHTVTFGKKSGKNGQGFRVKLMDFHLFKKPKGSFNTFLVVMSGGVD
jgi:hypothetical protein